MLNVQRRRKCRIDVPAYDAYCKQQGHGAADVWDEVVVVHYVSTNVFQAPRVHEYAMVSNAQFHNWAIPLRFLIPIHGRLT